MDTNPRRFYCSFLLIGSLISVSGARQRDLAARAIVPVPRLLALRDVLPDPVQTCGNTSASAL